MVNAGHRGAMLDLRGLHIPDCNVRSPRSGQEAIRRVTCFATGPSRSRRIQFRRNRFIIKMSSAIVHHFLSPVSFNSTHRFFFVDRFYPRLIDRFLLICFHFFYDYVNRRIVDFHVILKVYARV